MNKLIPLPGSSPRAAQPPPHLGGYTITRHRIGKGSQGTIWKATHPSRGVVAVKGSRRHKDARDTRAAKEALKTEWTVMRGLDHRHVLRVFDLLESGSVGYLAMEYMPGDTLMKKIDDKVLSGAEKIVIFRQLSEAVLYLHQHDVCHRDIKPSNVLFDRHGEPVLSDFGLAHLGLDCLNTAGTLRCLPPEVFELIKSGRTPVCYDGAAADVWSLGITLFATLTGTFPSALADKGWGNGVGRSATLYERIAVYGPPALHTLDPRAAQVIVGTLALKPRQRWKMEQVLSSSYVDEKNVATVRRQETRHSKLAGAGAITTTATAGAGGGCARSAYKHAAACDEDAGGLLARFHRGLLSGGGGDARARPASAPASGVATRTSAGGAGAPSPPRPRSRLSIRRQK